MSSLCLLCSVWLISLYSGLEYKIDLLFLIIKSAYTLLQGVVLSKLVEDFFNMKEEILSRDFDLGFSGNSEDVVMRALHLLGNCVNVTSSANRNGEFTIAPSQTVPALFELNFYSNGLFHVFISDAIIGTLSWEVVLLFHVHSGVWLIFALMFNVSLWFVSSLQHPVTAARDGGGIGVW